MLRLYNKAFTIWSIPAELFPSKYRGFHLNATHVYVFQSNLMCKSQVYYVKVIHFYHTSLFFFSVRTSLLLPNPNDQIFTFWAGYFNKFFILDKIRSCSVILVKQFLL